MDSKTQTNKYLIIKHKKGSFADISVIEARFSSTGMTKLIETKKEAKGVIDRFCDPSIANPHFDKQYAEYWESQRRFLEVFEVVETLTKIKL